MQFLLNALRVAALLDDVPAPSGDSRDDARRLRRRRARAGLDQNVRVRRGRGVAATRLCGLSARQPRRRCDVFSAEVPRAPPYVRKRLGVPDMSVLYDAVAATVIENDLRLSEFGRARRSASSSSQTRRRRRWRTSAQTSRSARRARGSSRSGRERRGPTACRASSPQRRATAFNSTSCRTGIRWSRSTASRRPT